MKAKDKPIIVQQIYNSSIENVWKAITEIGQMRKWYFQNIPEFKAEAGFETEFNVQSNERNFLHHWKVIEVQPLKEIKYSWTFSGYIGKSTSAFELFKEDNLTRLKLTVETLEDFPDDIPEFTTESCIAGWEYLIKNSLKHYLESNNKA